MVSIRVINGTIIGRAGLGLPIKYTLNVVAAIVETSKAIGTTAVRLWEPCSLARDWGV